MLSPAAWSVVQQVGRVLLASLFYFVIARLLSPAEMGVLGIATVWITLLGVFNELGFGAALIQRREIDDRHLGTVFILNVALGLLLFMGGVALAGPASRLMRVPQAGPVILVLSTGFIINAFATVQAALAARQLRFRALAIRDLGGVLIGGLVGVTMALKGWGIWSLVGQSLTTSVVGTALLWRVSPYRPRLSDWSPTVMPDLWHFSSRLFALSMFKYVVQNADALVIGYFFGPIRVGLYALSNKVLTQPIVAVESGVGAFLFSRASRLQEQRTRVAELYGMSYKALNYLALPLIAVCAVWGGLLVPAILGPEWTETGAIFGFLAVMGTMRPPITPMGQLMKALGKPDWFLRWGVCFSVLTIAGLLLGARFGFAGALFGLALAYVAMLPVAFSIVARLLPGMLPPILRTVVPSYVAGAAFYLTLWAFRHWGGPHIPVAVVSTAAATLLYVMLVRRSDPGFGALLRRQLVGLRPA